MSIAKIDGIVLQVERALDLLKKAHDIDEVRQIVAQGLAFRALMRELDASQEAVTVATELVTRARRRRGEMLAAMETSEGGRPPKTLPESGGVSKSAQLAAHGITTQRASEDERLARMPAAEFDDRVAALKSKGKEPTPGRVLASTVPRPTEITIRLTSGRRITLSISDARELLTKLPELLE